ncbi:hypothetical protein DPX16_12106 [Anabarilius grahami]|uniref:Uncharacterized protein n=1 Tax=Anabarilius grahami TaxID=495550 RepID=A0A3N0YY14_ANAGA|nr:hypothetical protein DPX16_12106 [Anabarilius grahami]
MADFKTVLHEASEHNESTCRISGSERQSKIQHDSRNETVRGEVLMEVEEFSWLQLETPELGETCAVFSSNNRGRKPVWRVDKSNKSALNTSDPSRYEKLQGKSFTGDRADATTLRDVLKWSLSDIQELFGFIIDIIAEMTRRQDDIAPSPVI